MIGRQTQWAYVKPFAYVEDMNGKAWRVVEGIGPRHGRATLVDRDGTQAVTPTIAPYDPVTVLEPTEAEALAALSAFGDLELIEERNH
jgi:hypothetical protein